VTAANVAGIGHANLRMRFILPNGIGRSRHHVYLVAIFLSWESYSSSAEGSFRGSPRHRPNNSGNRIWKGLCRFRIAQDQPGGELILLEVC
jgi:hypothetical protein